MSSMKKIMDGGYRPIDAQAWHGCGLMASSGLPDADPLKFVKLPGERDLSISEILEIRRRRHVSLKRLAKEFRISKAQIKEILR